MALTSTQQGDFGGGLYRGRDAPQNAAWDLDNLLIDDVGRPFRRGGSTYWSSSTTAASMRSIASYYFPFVTATRVLGWNGTQFWAFNGSKAPVLLYDSAADRTIYGRPAMVGGIAALSISQSASGGTLQGPALLLYAGALKPISASPYTTGTIAGTNGSATITGSGTSWLANVDPGAFFVEIGGAGFGIVKSITSNTGLVLDRPFAGTTGSGKTYEIFGTWVSAQPDPEGRETKCVSAAGSGTPRLLLGTDTRVYPSAFGDPLTYSDSEYLEIPSGEFILGSEGYGDGALTFTTGGVWRMTNLSLTAEDDFANIQWAQEKVNKDVLLWGDEGLTGWSGLTVVPAHDDIYLLGQDGTVESVSKSIRPLHRSYVAAGYKPGIAAVHAGHLFLPVLNGATLVDVLVCRLDRSAAWSRFSGHAAGTGFARMATNSSAPALLGINGQRVTDLTGTLAPTTANSQDADGTSHSATIITRDYPLGTQPGFCQRVRATYEMTSDGTHTAPSAAIAYSSDQDAGAWANLTEKGEQGGATGWGTSDGSKYQWALVAKRRTKIRFRLTFSGAAASVILRSLELLVRPQGRQ